MFLEFFRPSHGHEEVDEEQQRDDRDDNCFHAVLLKPVAKTHVESAHDEKHDDGANEEEVAHCPTFLLTLLKADISQNLKFSAGWLMNRIINSLNLERLLPRALIKRIAPDVKKSLTGQQQCPHRLPLRRSRCREVTMFSESRRSRAWRGLRSRRAGYPHIARSVGAFPQALRKGSGHWSCGARARLSLCSG